MEEEYKDQFPPEVVAIMKRVMPCDNMRIMTEKGYQVLIKWLEDDIKICQELLTKPILTDGQNTKINNRQTLFTTFRIYLQSQRMEKLGPSKK